MEEILKILFHFREKGYSDEQIKTAIEKMAEQGKITPEQCNVLIELLDATSREKKIKA